MLSKDRTRKKSDRPQPYVKVAAQIGHQLSIECQATGVPDVSIGWQKHFRPSKEEPFFLDDFKSKDATEDEIYKYLDLDESLFDDNKNIKETDSVKLKKRKYDLKNNKKNKEKRDYPISAYNEVSLVLKILYLKFQSFITFSETSTKFIDSFNLGL